MHMDQILNVLRVLCSEEHSSGTLHSKIDELWPVWDRDNDGYITLEETMDPEFGLLVFIVNKSVFAGNTAVDSIQGIGIQKEEKGD